MAFGATQGRCEREHWRPEFQLCFLSPRDFLFVRFLLYFGCDVVSRKLAFRTVGFLSIASVSLGKFFAGGGRGFLGWRMKFLGWYGRVWVSCVGIVDFTVPPVPDAVLRCGCATELLFSLFFLGLRENGCFGLMERIAQKKDEILFSRRNF